MTPHERAENPLQKQEGGSHYKNCRIQPVEYIHANGMGYIEGAVIKYVTRYKQKNGAEDIRKAIHFLELLLQLEYGDARETARAAFTPVQEEVCEAAAAPCDNCATPLCSQERARATSQTGVCGARVPL